MKENEIINSLSNWIKEYFKSFIVYGLQAIINISVLWLCIIVFNFNIYFSQAIAVFFTVIFSYRAHKKFTFNI